MDIFKTISYNSSIIHFIAKDNMGHKYGGCLMESKAIIPGVVDMYQPVKMAAAHLWRETPANTQNNTIVLAMCGALAFIGYAIHEHYCVKITPNGVTLEPSTITA